jgi:hypothetical protein
LLDILQDKIQIGEEKMKQEEKGPWDFLQESVKMT